MQLEQRPAERFGMSSVRFNTPEMPAHLPERQLLEAANQFNEHRFVRLTGRQRLFVDEYFRQGLDEGAAARAAFLVPTDASDVEAAKAGRKLLRKKYIADAVEAGWSYHREATKLSFSDVVEEIKKIAFSNIADFFKNDGTGDPYLCMPEEHELHKLAAVQEITVESYNEGRGPAAREVKRIKLKLYNKLEALDKLLKLVSAATGGEAASPAGEAATTTNNVSVINLVAVPSGSFLPPPQAPTGPLIEHSPLINIAAGA